MGFYHVLTLATCSYALLTKHNKTEDLMCVHYTQDVLAYIIPKMYYYDVTI